MRRRVRTGWSWLAVVLALSACRRDGGGGAAAVPAPAARYAPSSSCAGCHADIARAYARTGMGRAFAAFDPARTPADFRPGRNRFYHAASNRTYTMRLNPGGKTAVMRRHQTGFGGREDNVVEYSIDYILGSGHAAQSFLHRTAQNELIQLPVAWYTERGGYWAMNPGYDRRDHPDFRRRAGYDCYFCHNAYPAATEAGYADAVWAEPVVFPARLPSGIDCQRCHGPGWEHVESGGKAAILNPKKLPRERALEVCYQCHLQSTSTPLPYAIVKPGRGVFSYRADEPLGNYTQHFDHAPGSGRGDKFEVAHAAYRLRQSACFTQSGRMTCTTCHNPHDVRRGAGAVAEVTLACKGCHAAPSPAAHRAPAECVSCHMPARRTDDVVHAVVTDHRIVRRPAPGDLTAPRPEQAPPPYQGRVIAYYPAKADPIDLAIGQVRAASNLNEGIRELEAALAANPGACTADCYFELAEAYGRAGRPADALRAGERAGTGARAQAAMGSALSALGQLERGASHLAKAGDLARAKHDLGLNYLKQGRLDDAATALHSAIALDPGAPEFHSTLASLYYSRRDFAAAEREFREAVRLKPDYALARANLAVLLIQRDAMAEAAFQFEAALKAEPDNAAVRRLYDRARGRQ